MTTAKIIFLYLSFLMPMEHAEIATRQAILETGWFRSYAFKELKNPFGLMWMGKVQRFESYKEACEEYKRQIYDQYNGGNYYLFLDTLPYAERGGGYSAYLKRFDLNILD